MIWNLYDAVNATCNALIVGLPLICFPMLILHSVIHRNDAPQAIATADTIAAADAKDLHSDSPQAIATVETIATVDTNNDPHTTTQKSIVRSLLGIERALSQKYGAIMWRSVSPAPISSSCPMPRRSSGSIFKTTSSCSTCAGIAATP